MREEFELEVLERYDIEVRSTRRIRGAFFCDTNEGPMLLKETGMSGQRALLLCELLGKIGKECGLNTDVPVLTKDGEAVTCSGDGTAYLLKKWYQGRECDIRQEGELARAAEMLALFHNAADSIDISENRELQKLPEGKNPADELRRHNRELKKVRTFVRGRTAKNEFEFLFLENFEKMYTIAERIPEMLEQSGCVRLYEESIRNGSIVHGDFNYHNVLIVKDQIALTGFERFHKGIQVGDLYYFIRKAMEKNHWKRNTGLKILDAYQCIRQLGEEEKAYLGLSLEYPEKFWKTVSSYYHTNKALLPGKYVEKLKVAVRQSDEKHEFLRMLFPSVF